jgi:hypothetical protein
MRIMVVGAPGSGKSRLSASLAAQLRLPLRRLDDYYWLDHWQRPEPAEWLRSLELLVSDPAWIIDGNYSDSLEIRLAAADLVILLDVGGWRSVLGLFRRTLSWWAGDTRTLPARIADGCRQPPPVRNFVRVLKKSVSFRQRILPGMTELIAARQVPVVILRSRQEAARVATPAGLARIRVSAGTVDG